MEDQARGQEIMQAVFKASMQALFAIGVKSSDNIDKFTLHFSNAIDKEFLKIGLLPNQVDQIEAQAGSSVSGEVGVETLEQPSGLDLSREAGFTTLNYGKTEAMIAILELPPLVTYNLKKAGIETIDELMTRMQQQALTDIKGIKEKSAKQILEKLATYQKGTHD